MLRGAARPDITCSEAHAHAHEGKRETTTARGGWWLQKLVVQNALEFDPIASDLPEGCEVYPPSTH